MTHSTVENENFLEASCGNYLDCIGNVIYGLQTYINVFHNDVSSIYLEYNKVEDKQVRDILKFVVMEAENIAKSKAIVFVTDVTNLFDKKYKSLCEKFRHEEDNQTYIFSIDAYLYLNKYQDAIDWQKLVSNPYFKKSETRDEIYNFTGFMEHEFEEYQQMQFEMCNEPITRREFLTILNGAFTKLNVTLLQLKRMVENSNSMYTSGLICRKTITILIIVYEVLSTIKIYNE